MKPTFDELVAEALAAPFEGWDFSWLDGRLTEDPLPWEYPERVRSRMGACDSMLDMGTGGGEILASLAPYPARVCAIETYPPNVVVARKRLVPLGVEVHDTSNDPENEDLPFGDGEFDLVINRHESYVPEEVARILRPGGAFITQQCGGYGGADLFEFFQDDTEYMDWTAQIAAGQLEEAGFKIVVQREAYPTYSFLNVGAVAYYLTAIPWPIDDFSVEKYRGRLLAMHEHIQEHGRFTVRDERFLVEAVRA